jgi:hypothetical protein
LWKHREIRKHQSLCGLCESPQANLSPEPPTSEKKTTPQFVADARQRHGDRYDYSKVQYVDSHVQIEIVCRKHGPFNQTPAHHLNGQGCRQCGKTTGVQKLTSTTTSFINKARQKHGDRYDYSKVRYIRDKVKVEIVCSKHGPFWQTPGDHLYHQRRTPTISTSRLTR